MAAGITFKNTDFTVIVTGFDGGQAQFSSALTVGQFRRFWSE